MMYCSNIVIALFCDVVLWKVITAIAPDYSVEVYVIARCHERIFLNHQLFSLSCMVVS